MKAVKNLMNTAEAKPGEACKEDAGKATEKANEAADKLAEAASKLREAYEAAKACGAANPGQAPASAAAWSPTSGANEILAAAPIGTRGFGGAVAMAVTVVTTTMDRNRDQRGHGRRGSDNVIDRAMEYIDDGDYDRAVGRVRQVLQRTRTTCLPPRPGATHLLRGGYNYAIRDYDRLLSIQEEPDADLYYNRGCAHLAAGRLERR